MPKRQPKEKKVRRKRSQLVLFLRDAGIAFAFVVLLLVAMFAYTGLWPPLVVIESDSMMHGPDNTSHIGNIDTGDLVLVKKVDQKSDIVTYMEGRSTGHRTYGDYGDVIIYHHMGSTTRTPIIHRALLYLQLNPDGRSYSSEDLRSAPGGSWTPYNSSNTWSTLTANIILNSIGYDHQNLSIPIEQILRTLAPTSGYVTKGDHNTATDLSWSGYEPVKLEWVVGKARGEIPWFGLLKLWSSGTLKTPAPANSVRDLWITIGLIVMTPIIIDVVLTFKERRARSRKLEKIAQGRSVNDSEGETSVEKLDNEKAGPPANK